MQNNLTITSITLICSTFLGSCVLPYQTTPLVIQSSNTEQSIISRPQITDIHTHTMKDEIGANPESTRQIRETYMEKPYRIDISPGYNEVQIYLPTFFEQSIKKQNEFSEKLQKLEKYTLAINVFGYSQFEKDKIRKFYNSLQPQFSAITYRFYDIPINYYEIFSELQFNITGKDLTVEFYGKMFPDGFMMDSFIDTIKEMLNRNLSKGDILNSISFNHEEAGNIYFMLTQAGFKELQSLPTRSLYTKRILIDPTLQGPGDTLYGKRKIEKFFQESPIEHIRMENLGEKNGANVNLYGF